MSLQHCYGFFVNKIIVWLVLGAPNFTLNLLLLDSRVYSFRHVFCVVKTGKTIAMSGYLEVKYPFKSNLGLNPFKVISAQYYFVSLYVPHCKFKLNLNFFSQSWKRQWCILRPSPTFSGGILAVYCSEAGASAGTIELPSGFVVRRAKSRTRPHAFAVFPADEPRKPRVLLAANTLQDAHNWMDKLKSQMNGNKLIGN